MTTYTVASSEAGFDNAIFDGDKLIVASVKSSLGKTFTVADDSKLALAANLGNSLRHIGALNANGTAKEGVQLGAGEILLTSMNNDGTKNGFANDITKLISENVNVPVIASGGAGTMNHFIDTFNIGKADAALAASVFHYSEINIMDLKHELKNNKIEVRI